ncbi:DNA-directed RNA polymerase subunit omega [Lactococcus fujiensis]|uniref:DNA-directed RNA polymerase subunit omega n=1 Tax=Lactococcus fujiensis JCM 16395 TaxID=1291764 RepID=A0A2A5RMG4_9LACT|nr:DNA-directed RNA polymerase subunit omega [Lactococcus fujiensis]PCS00483.1 DNA-directed RNA polymerase subunit omega [Lactococcus fujiensis JCM 16395]
MMLEPSIDKLLEKVDSKYSLVILEAKRAHELREGERPTKKNYKSVKQTLQALEEIADGTVTIHPAPEAKRKTLVEKRELERLEAKMTEKKIKEQIAKEEAEEEAKSKGSRASKASAEEKE